MQATPEKQYDLSVLVPFYNEEENLAENYRQIRLSLDSLPESSEIVYINDGSTDAGADVIKNICAKDPCVRLVSFVKNYGQTAAMEAAFKEARGKVYITLDADNQNDPADIPMLLNKMKEGFDVVSGWRKKRRDGFFLRTLPSRIANWLISRVTGVHLKDYGCTLKAYDSFYLDQVNLYGEMHRFIPAYAKYAGARVTEISVNHRPRTRGISKYGLNRTIKVVLDLLTVKFLGDYATKPIYFFGGMGLVFMLVSFLVAVFVLYQKFAWGVFVHRNPLFILSVFVFMLAAVLPMLGLIGELLTRTYYEAQAKKPYRVKEKVGF